MNEGTGCKSLRKLGGKKIAYAVGRYGDVVLLVRSFYSEKMLLKFQEEGFQKADSWYITRL